MNLTLLIIIIAFLLVGVGAAIIYFLSSQIKSLKENLSNKDSEKVLMEWLREMKGSVDKNSETVERQLNDQRDAMNKQTKMIWERLDNAAKVVGDVQQQLGGINEFSKDMKDLSNVLKSPKLRGGLGEKFLYEILENYLPKDLYKTQYKFRDGTLCDAVIITERGIIPIDSKFSMENFRAMHIAETDIERDRAKKEFIKDVKKRIDEIAGKYILPDEGTTDQAVMYIPSESIYYELITNTPDIEDYSKQKNVVLTSPNTFAYFVKIILVGYQQNALAKHAGEILKALSGIKNEAAKFEEELNVLDGHVNRTSKSIDTVKTKFAKLFGKISAVEALSDGDDIKMLEEEERLL